MRRKSILSKIIFCVIFVLSYLVSNYVLSSLKVRFHGFLPELSSLGDMFLFLEVLILVLISYFSTNLVVYGRFSTKGIR